MHTKSAMNLLKSVALASCLLWMNGCASTSPNIPKSLTYDTPVTMYSMNEFNNDLAAYRLAYDGNDIAHATRLRNSMISRIRVEVEINYHQFESQLYSDRATFNTGADMAELAMSAAITITGGAHAKTVLAAILTAAKGSRLSYDKNWFREKTTETIIASMESERNKKLLLIMGKMANGTAAQYTFEEAWSDLVDYFYAGTLEGGVQALSVETGKAAADAKKDLHDATKDRIATLMKATREEITTVEGLTDRLKQLFDANNVQEAKRILAALNIVPTEGQDVFQLLRAQIDALQPGDAAALARLSKAFNHQP